MRMIIETSPGRYKDPTTNKRTSKREGDKVVSAEQYEQANRSASQVRAATGARAPQKRKAEKQERQPVRLSTGVLTLDPVVEIKCRNANKNVEGCEKTRVIKKQDKFQVKFCVSCQNKNRNELRRKRRQAARESAAKA